MTPAQRRVLDEILGRHDRTGPDWAARIIAATPGAEDPLAAVVAADREWQAERRPDVLAAELEWDATKLEERREAKGALTHIRDVLG